MTLSNAKLAATLTFSTTRSRSSILILKYGPAAMLRPNVSSTTACVVLLNVTVAVSDAPGSLSEILSPRPSATSSTVISPATPLLLEIKANCPLARVIVPSPKFSPILSPVIFRVSLAAPFIVTLCVSTKKVPVID